jgi:hypothetical protein
MQDHFGSADSFHTRIKLVALPLFLKTFAEITEQNKQKKQQLAIMEE